MSIRIERFTGNIKMQLTPDDRQKYIEDFAASIEQGRHLLQGKGQIAGPILMRAEGVNANLLLLDDRVRIQRREEKTFLNQGFGRDKEILLSQITAVRLRKATKLGNGFIQLALAGAPEVSDAEVARDQNTILFRNTRQVEFERIKTAIEMRKSVTRAVMPQSLPQYQPSPQYQPPPPPRAPSYIEELEQLASLRDKGVITEEEFAAKKRQILGI